jgi:hypothetical protein
MEYDDIEQLQHSLHLNTRRGHRVNLVTSRQWRRTQLSSVVVGQSFAQRVANVLEGKVVDDQ